LTNAQTQLNIKLVPWQEIFGAWLTDALKDWAIVLHHHSAIVPDVHPFKLTHDQTVVRL
jgi:hypothetical protein